MRFSLIFDLYQSLIGPRISNVPSGHSRHTVFQQNGLISG